MKWSADRDRNARGTVATSERLDDWAQEFEGELAPGHFRTVDGLAASSIGIGTYLGGPDEQTDRRYQDVIVESIIRGANVVDTAASYRCQRSERTIGRAIRQLLQSTPIERDWIIVCTKGGILPFDGEPPDDPTRYVEERFIVPGIVSRHEMGAGGHCISPRFLSTQIDQSRHNLGIDTIDVYHLENVELQLMMRPRLEFLDSVRRAFDRLEEAAAEGRIRYYGVATWDGLRRSPEAEDYLSLEELMGVANEVGGPSHRFRFVQLPFNPRSPQALTDRNQTVGGESVSVLEAAGRLRLGVMTSAPFQHGRLLNDPLPRSLSGVLPRAATDAQRLLQFERSAPNVTTVFFGTQRVDHARENLGLAHVPPLGRDAFEQLVPADAPQVPWLF